VDKLVFLVGINNKRVFLRLYQRDLCASVSRSKEIAASSDPEYQYHLKRKTNLKASDLKIMDILKGDILVSLF
jgi:hypothetical protein